MTYWSCHFKPKKISPANTAAKRATNARMVQGRIDHLETGLYNCMERWNGMSGKKDYHLKLDTDPGTVKIELEPYVIFEPKQVIKYKNDGSSTVIERGGKHKCLVNVKDMERSNMAPSEGNFGPSTWNPSGSASSADYDGATGKRLTVAHELGHSTGLDDEYLEKLWIKYTKSGTKSYFYYTVPQYGQYYHGMPYSIDRSSMMRSNKLIRMRHFWCRVNWLNGEGGSGTPLRRFLKGAQFKITHDVKRTPSGGGAAVTKTLEYKLPRNLRDIYRRAFYERNYNFGTAAKVAKGDIIVYKLADDEWNRSLDKPNSFEAYDAIAVLRMNVSVSFKPAVYADEDDRVAGDTGFVASTWNWSQRRTWLRSLQTAMRTTYFGKFRLQGASGLYKNTLVIIIPHFKITSPRAVPGQSGSLWVKGSTHFKINVSKGNSNFAATSTGTITMTVGDGCNVNKIVRRFFGLGTAVNTALTKTDLPQLEAWATANLSGGTFDLKDVP